MMQFTSEFSSPVNSSLSRFDARYFSLDFRYGSVATVVANTATSLTLNCQFRSNLDLIGLFWKSADSFGHPALKYVTDKDYTGCVYAFVANPIDPYNFSLTVKSGAKSYIYRLFPYKISGSNLICDVTDPVTQGTGTGLTYTTSSVFPGGLTIPSGSQVYIVDFNKLKQGYTFTGGVIPSTNIDSMFFAVTSASYGVGGTATLASASNVNLNNWVINNIQSGFRCAVGDSFVVSYTQGTQYLTETVIARAGFSVVGTTLTLPMDTPRTGVTWTGSKVTSLSLSLDSAIGDVAYQFVMGNISVTGSRTTIGKYNYPQPVNGLRMATGYDDTYNITPWRQIDQIYNLGYRNDIVCYMGASHYYQSSSSYISGNYYNLLDTTASNPLNTPTQAWMTSLFAEIASKGMTFILSHSLEILNSAIPAAWAQKDDNSNLALTGYNPPTSFITLTNSDAKAYLIALFKAGLSLMNSAGLALKWQMGEFWWWDGSYSNGVPSIYDFGTKTAYHTATGLFAPTTITNIYQTLNSAEIAYATWLGNTLGQFTLDIKTAVKATYSSSQCCMLFFSPQIFASNSQLLPLINFPSSYWQYPAFDFMQIEDYDWIINGQIGRLPLTRQAATTTATLPSGQSGLGYPTSSVHYFIGFVPVGNQTLALGSQPGATGSLNIWDYCSIALDQALDAGLTHNYVWAYPQVIRDGILLTDQNPQEPKFPLSQSYFAFPQPEFNTAIESTDSDHEVRKNSWGGLCRYSFVLQSRDILPTDTGTLKGDYNNVSAFVQTLIQGKTPNFRTKKGVFRLNCATDNSVTNQLIGTGNGTTVNFQLLKTYAFDNAVYTRAITKPNAQPNIYLNGTLQTSGYYCDLFSGIISFAYPPATGVLITADISYDFPVRFTNDPFPFSLDVNFGTSGMDELTFVEDMDVVNALPSNFGTQSESRFPLSHSYHITGQPKSKSAFSSTECGKQYRNSMYSKNLLYEFDMQARDILPIDTGNLLGEFNNIINFFICIAQGKLNSFRLNFPLDNSATAQVIGTGDGTTTQFQIIKTYTSGSLSYTRKITKPVVGTVVPHWSSGTFTFSVDYTTGIITFNTAPASGVIITCDYQFDYLVRLSENKLNTTLDVNFGTFGMEDIKFIEVRN